MVRRTTIALVGLLALVLAACEINVDYDLLLNADGTSEMEVEITYDETASELLGPPEAFLDELEQDTETQIEGVEVLDSSADSSDPDAQRVTVVFGAADPQALDQLVRDNFAGTYSEVEDDVFELVLLSEDAGMDDEFGDMDDLGMDMDMDFMSGSLVLRHDGERQELSGGDGVDDQTVEWDPFGAEDLRVVVDLAAGGTAGGGDFPLWLVLVLVGLLLVVGLVVVIVLVARKGRGGAEPAGTAPMTGPSAGEVDAMQTPPTGDPAPAAAPPTGEGQQWQPEQPTSGPGAARYPDTGPPPGQDPSAQPPGQDPSAQPPAKGPGTAAPPPQQDPPPAQGPASPPPPSDDPSAWAPPTTPSPPPAQDPDDPQRPPAGS